jgi:hypothetical protein
MEAETRVMGSNNKGLPESLEIGKSMGKKSSLEPLV